MTTDAKPLPHPDDAGLPCTVCHGRGWVPHDDVPRAVCGTCDGTGYPQSWAAQEIRRLDAEVSRLRAAHASALARAEAAEKERDEALAACAQAYDAGRDSNIAESSEIEELERLRYKITDAHAKLREAERAARVTSVSLDGAILELGSLRDAMREIGFRISTIQCGAHQGRYEEGCDTCRGIEVIHHLASGDHREQWTAIHEARDARNRAVAAIHERDEARAERDEARRTVDAKGQAQREAESEFAEWLAAAERDAASLRERVRALVEAIQPLAHAYAEGAGDRAGSVCLYVSEDDLERARALLAPTKETTPARETIMTKPLRNPQRVLQALDAYLRQNPSVRVGQAIVNHLPSRYGNDAFYVEDDDLAAILEASLSSPPPEPHDA